MKPYYRLAGILAIVTAGGTCQTQAQIVTRTASSGSAAVATRELLPLDRTPLAIMNVSVIPMNQDAILADQNVVIEDGTIVAVGPAASTPVPEGARRLDGSGLFLMPGLIDAHAHLQYQADSSANPTLLRLYLAHGVTTIVNLLGLPEHLVLREQIARGEVVGPQIYTSGFYVNPPYVKDIGEVARSVRETQAAGFDFVKIHGDMPLAWYDSLFAAAREARIPVIGHAPRTLGMRVAFERGMAAVAHVEEFMYAYFAPAHTAAVEAVGLETYVAGIADSTFSARTSVMTTLTAFARIPDLATSLERLMTQDSAPLLSDGIREEWTRQAARIRSRWEDDAADAHDRQYRLQELIVRALGDRGVRLLVGTDAPVNGTVPGPAMHEELRRLVDAGLSPSRVLRAATADAATFLGSTAGVVSVGRRADLLLLEGNPLEAIEHSRSIRAVILRGRILGKVGSLGAQEQPR